MARARRYRGVRQRHWGSWVAEIRHPILKTRLWLGTFKTEEEAALAYDEAACFMSGSNAHRINFPPPFTPKKPVRLSALLLAKLRRCQQLAANLRLSKPASPTTHDQQAAQDSGQFYVAAECAKTATTAPIMGGHGNSCCRRHASSSPLTTTAVDTASVISGRRRPSVASVNVVVGPSTYVPPSADDVVDRRTGIRSSCKQLPSSSWAESSSSFTCLRLSSLRPQDQVDPHHQLGVWSTSSNLPTTSGGGEYCNNNTSTWLLSDLHLGLDLHANLDGLASSPQDTSTVSNYHRTAAALSLITVAASARSKATASAQDATTCRENMIGAAAELNSKPIMINDVVLSTTTSSDTFFHRNIISSSRCQPSSERPHPNGADHNHHDFISNCAQQRLRPAAPSCSISAHDINMEELNGYGCIDIDDCMSKAWLENNQCASCGSDARAAVSADDASHGFQELTVNQACTCDFTVHAANQLQLSNDDSLQAVLTWADTYNCQLPVTTTPSDRRYAAGSVDAAAGSTSGTTTGHGIFDEHIVVDLPNYLRSGSRDAGAHSIARSTSNFNIPGGVDVELDLIAESTSQQTIEEQFLLRHGKPDSHQAESSASFTIQRSFDHVQQLIIDTRTGSRSAAVLDYVDECTCGEILSSYHTPTMSSGNHMMNRSQRRLDHEKTCKSCCCSRCCAEYCEDCIGAALVVVRADATNIPSDFGVTAAASQAPSAVSWASCSNIGEADRSLLNSTAFTSGGGDGGATTSTLSCASANSTC